MIGYIGGNNMGFFKDLNADFTQGGEDILSEDGVMVDRGPVVNDLHNPDRDGMGGQPFFQNEFTSMDETLVEPGFDDVDFVQAEMEQNKMDLEMDGFQFTPDKMSEAMPKEDRLNQTANKRAKQKVSKEEELKFNDNLEDFITELDEEMDDVFDFDSKVEEPSFMRNSNKHKMESESATKRKSSINKGKMPEKEKPMSSHEKSRLFREREAQSMMSENANERMFTNNEKREKVNPVTVIGKETKIVGNVSSDVSIEVNGSVIGDITCQGKLVVNGMVKGNSHADEVIVNAKRLEGNILSEGNVNISKGTVVVGDIVATESVISGAVKGEIDVQGRVILNSSAIVKGNIKAKSVQIDNGAVVDGYCSLTYGSVDLEDLFDETQK